MLIESNVLIMTSSILKCVVSIRVRQYMPRRVCVNVCGHLASILGIIEKRQKVIDRYV